MIFLQALTIRAHRLVLLHSTIGGRVTEENCRYTAHLEQLFNEECCDTGGNVGTDELA